MLAQKHPNWTDEQLYQGARQIVIGEIQAITFNQFLPSLLGPNALTAYRGYNPNVNPGIVVGGLSTSLSWTALNAPPSWTFGSTIARV